MNTIREQLFQRLLPIADRFAGDIVELINARIDEEVARVDEAISIALSAYASNAEEAADVEVTKPVRDRKVARAAVPEPRVGRIAEVARARADRGDRAPAVPAAVASAAKPAPPAAAAVKRQRAQMRCSKCGELGFRSDGCGRTHNVVPSIDEPPASDDEGPGAAMEPAVEQSPRPGRRGRSFLGARAFTIPQKTSDGRAFQRLHVDVLAGEDELRELEALRPKIRGECANVPRPCPFVSCEQHLYLDVDPETGSLKINFPNVEPTDLIESCTLDRAERGAITLEETGVLMNVTRERARQLELSASIHLRAKCVEAGIDDEALAYFQHPEQGMEPE